MNRKLCIHGHFYQPPRENPWLEDIELQDSAYPYHDWNEKITDECYSKNLSSRILDDKKKIIDIVKNYSMISFDFGPTLLIWLEKHHPDVYQGIIQSDKEGAELFSGHGPAIAQAYNHMIMPLANERDKKTQIIWGIRDFETRFNRKPEGMWLPETAVDYQTLDLLAHNDIKFTILAPHQAKAIKKTDEKEWVSVKQTPIDTTKPYICKLDSGKQIAIFFYQGGPSSDVAYGGLLNQGDIMAKEITKALELIPKSAQLAHIATDGETYGHHHRYADMALSYCLHYIKSNNLADITIYGEFLENFPPDTEVQIHENTSWSCAHGIERWRDNCGCVANGTL